MTHITDHVGTIAARLAASPALMASLEKTAQAERFDQRKAAADALAARLAELDAASPALQAELKGAEESYRLAQTALTAADEALRAVRRRIGLLACSRDEARAVHDRVMTATRDERIRPLLGMCSATEPRLRATYAAGQQFEGYQLDGKPKNRHFDNADSIAEKVAEVRKIRDRLHELELAAVEPEQLDKELDELRAKLQKLSPIPLAG